MSIAPVLTPATTLAELFAGLAEVPPVLDRPVAALTEDSREVRAGSVFFARRGQRSDGARFATDALAAGAVAVVHEGRGGSEALGADATLVRVPDLRAAMGTAGDRFFGEPSRALSVVGVTGTNGKTSVTHLVAQGLGDAGRVIGTLGFGRPGALASGTLTTPGSLDVHRQLAEARDAGARAVAMEVSSHALDQQRVAGVRFEGAVLTNLSREHLDYHRDMSGYARAKRALFDRPGLRFAVLNADDAFGRELARAMPAAVETIVYGLDRPSGAPEPASGRALVGEVLALGPDGLRLAARGPWGEAELHTRLVGRFNALNVLAALATLLALGEPIDAVSRALAAAPPVPGRMQRFGGTAGRPLVVVDYAHTPDALAQAIAALREQCSGALWCVFGCGGERDPGKRPEMGRCAERLADELVLTDDNPRGEDGDRIVADVLAGLRHPERAFVERDRGAAILAAVRSAGESDVVLVAGKGHEDYQESGGERRPFSDAGAVRAALEEART